MCKTLEALQKKCLEVVTSVKHLANYVGTSSRAAEVVKQYWPRKWELAIWPLSIINKNARPIKKHKWGFWRLGEGHSTFVELATGLSQPGKNKSLCWIQQRIKDHYSNADFFGIKRKLQAGGNMGLKIIASRMTRSPARTQKSTSGLDRSTVKFGNWDELQKLFVLVEHAGGWNSIGKSVPGWLKTSAQIVWPKQQAYFRGAEIYILIVYCQKKIDALFSTFLGNKFS